MTKNVLLTLGIGGALLCAPSFASSTKPFAPVPTSSAAPLVPPADPEHFTFAVGGDNRSTGHGYPMPPALDEICREIGIVHPPFVLWTGDVIEGYGDTPAEANAEYDTFLKAAALTGVPLFNAPGNHEYSLDPALVPIYRKRMGGSLYGSFDYGHSHFVALNSTPVSPDGKPGVGGTLDDAQWQWLQADLEANKGARNVFVFLHHYLFGPADPDTPDMATGWNSLAERDRFHALMVKYGVRMVIAGHNHIYYHTEKDGVQYVISGASGAPLDASPDQGGFLHYLIVHVDGASVTWDILQPWELQETYPDSGKSRVGIPGARAWVDNSNNMAVTVNHVVLHAPAPPAGQKLTVQAGVAYKKKTKTAKASIVSVTPDAGGKTVTVIVAATLPPHRTTEVVVGPASPLSAKQ